MAFNAATEAANMLSSIKGSSGSGVSASNTNTSTGSIMPWIFAAVVYALVGQFMDTKTLTAFSFLLIFGALFVNKRSGHNVLTDLGV